MFSTMNAIKKIAVCFTALFAAACGALAAASGSYKLCPLDVLDIKVFQEPDLNTTYKVSAEGNVVMPLIGVVPVAGLTVAQAQERLQELYGKDYLVNPSVSIFILQYAPRRVYVIGQVGRPGEVVFPNEEELTLSRAIANAGGVTRIAKDRAINVKRRMPNGSMRVFEIDLRAILNDKNATDFPLQDGDTIEVQESAF